MRRFIPCCFLLALVVSAPVQAATSVSVGVMLGNGPPPPRLEFRGEPRMIVMPTCGVSYYEGPGEYDYFRYGEYFYIYNDNYWYRAPHSRGPFVVIRETYVPRVFYGLRDRGYHWRHGWRQAPPGQYRRMERREDRREDRREGDRGHGHEHKGGHGHGHDKD